MRILNSNKLKWDKKYLIAYIIVIIAAIICGIVLYILNNISNYIYDFADVYVFYVFNFQNGTLFITHFLAELFFLYVVFAIGYFTKLKFLACPVIFFKTLFTALYAIVLCALFATEGVIVVILVYLPSFILSVAAMIFICEQCKQIFQPLCFFFPAILALLSALIFLLLVNVLFRFVVVIV